MVLAAPGDAAADDQREIAEKAKAGDANAVAGLLRPAPRAVNLDFKLRLPIAF
jgi:hypothetical protein